MTVPLDSPFDPNAIETDPAVTALRMSFGLAVTPPPEQTQLTLTTRRAAFDVENYLPWYGVAVDTPGLLASMATIGGIGTYTYGEPEVDPRLEDLGDAIRWIPDDSYVLAGDWEPTIGDQSMSWTTPGPGTAPVLDPDYTYQRNDDLDLTRAALVFAGGQWLTVNQPGYVASGFTIVVVAVLHSGSGSYSIVETVRPDVPADDVRSIALRYRAGVLSVVSNGALVSHALTTAHASPVIIGLSVDTVSGRLVVLERTRSSRTFSLAGAEPWDASLYLGRMRDTEEARYTAEMELLEVAYWPSALPTAELDQYVSSLNAAYGVSK